MFIAMWTLPVIDSALGLDSQEPTAPRHLRGGLGSDLTSMGVSEGAAHRLRLQVIGLDQAAPCG